MRGREYRVLPPGEMASYPPLPVLVPLVAFELDELTNINDVLYMSPKARAGAIGSARNYGYKIGIAAGRALGIKIEIKRKKGGGKSMREYAIEMLADPVTDLGIFTLLSVWHTRSIKDPAKGNRKRDVYNPLVKAVIDGLTDAGLWVDDSSEYHTDYRVTYKGLADRGKVVLAFYGDRGNPTQD